jgi:cell division protein FtsL
MIRVATFFCFAVSALACLALYHVSEQTRVARTELSAVHRQIAAEQQSLHTLEAEWGRVADPARIQHLAQARLGMDDAPAMELSSLKLLPRRGDEAPLSEGQVRTASAVVQAGDPRVRLAAVQAGD